MTPNDIHNLLEDFLPWIESLNDEDFITLEDAVSNETDKRWPSWKENYGL